MLKNPSRPNFQPTFLSWLEYHILKELTEFQFAMRPGDLFKQIVVSNRDYTRERVSALKILRVLERMEGKGWVLRRDEGRKQIFFIPTEEVRAKMLEYLKSKK